MGDFTRTTPQKNSPIRVATNRTAPHNYLAPHSVTELSRF